MFATIRTNNIVSQLFTFVKRSDESQATVMTIQRTAQILRTVETYAYHLRMNGKVSGTATKHDGSESLRVQIFSDYTFVTLELDGQCVAVNVTIDELETILVSMQPEFLNVAV